MSHHFGQFILFLLGVFKKTPPALLRRYGSPKSLRGSLRFLSTADTPAKLVPRTPQRRFEGRCAPFWTASHIILTRTKLVPRPAAALLLSLRLVRDHHLGDEVRLGGLHLEAGTAERLGNIVFDVAAMVGLMKIIGEAA